jgi:hypothetical protein
VYCYAVSYVPWYILAFSARRWSNNVSGYNIFFKTVLYEAVQHKAHNCIWFHAAFMSTTNPVLSYRIFIFRPHPTHSDS